MAELVNQQVVANQYTGSTKVDPRDTLGKGTYLLMEISNNDLFKRFSQSQFLETEQLAVSVGTQTERSSVAGSTQTFWTTMSGSTQTDDSENCFLTASSEDQKVLKCDASGDSADYECGYKHELTGLAQTSHFYLFFPVLHWTPLQMDAQGGIVFCPFYFRFQVELVAQNQYREKMLRIIVKCRHDITKRTKPK